MASMPRSVAKRIMRRASAGEKSVVVTIKNGKPSRVFGFDEYLSRKEHTKKAKPWLKRKRSRSSYPFPTTGGTVRGSLSRRDIYGEQ